MASDSSFELACEEGRLWPAITESSSPFLPFEAPEDSPHRSKHRLGRIWKDLSSRIAACSKCCHDTCHKFSWTWLVIGRTLWYSIWILGFVNALSLILSGLVYFFPNELDARLDAWAFPRGSSWATHGVLPVQCHSHNDYTRRVPLYSAIQAGCVSVEADIWISGDDLLVGHNRFTLHPAVTLKNLYLDPLLDMLEKHNTRSSALQPDREDNQSLAGVFANNVSQTLVLLIDFKTGGYNTLACLLEQLAHLQERGYLTHFNGLEVVQRPVTVVASGDAPFHDITANRTPPYIFLDAPLSKLTRNIPDGRTKGPGFAGNQTSSSIVYNYTNSYYASADFRETVGRLSGNAFSPDQLACVQAQVAAAHEKGLKVRYWGTPTWPTGLRNHVWHVLLREQVDVINVDDLSGATKQDWRKHWLWFLYVESIYLMRNPHQLRSQ